MIVVDTNILICMFLERPETPRTQEIFKRDPEWAAPAFWRVEFLNALSNYCKFAGLPREKASDIWRQASEWKNLREGEVDFSQGLKLSIDHRISGYDALFVALAKSLNTVCVTQDKALRKAVPRLTVSMDEFLK